MENGGAAASASAPTPVAPTVTATPDAGGAGNTAATTQPVQPTLEAVAQAANGLMTDMHRVMAENVVLKRDLADLGAQMATSFADFAAKAAETETKLAKQIREAEITIDELKTTVKSFDGEQLSDKASTPPGRGWQQSQNAKELHGWGGPAEQLFTRWRWVFVAGLNGIRPGLARAVKWAEGCASDTDVKADNYPPRPRQRDAIRGG